MRKYLISKGIIKAQAKCRCKIDGVVAPYVYVPKDEYGPEGWFCEVCGKGHIREDSKIENNK